MLAGYELELWSSEPILHGFNLVQGFLSALKLLSHIQHADKHALTIFVGGHVIKTVLYSFYYKEDFSFHSNLFK